MGTPTDDPRSQAIAAINARRDFWRTAAGFVLIEIVLIVIWAVSGEGHFWPIWPAIGFAFAIGGQGMRTFGKQGPTEQEIQREIERRRSP